MDTTGFKSMSNSYINGMPVGRLRPVMASSDNPARQRLPSRNSWRQQISHWVTVCCNTWGCVCTLHCNMTLQLYSWNTEIAFHLKFRKLNWQNDVVILKCTYLKNKDCGRVWTGFIYCAGRLCRKWQWIFGFQKMDRTSSPAEQLEYFQQDFIQWH